MRILFSLLVLSLVTACGFRPLYGTNGATSDPDTSAFLASIDVRASDDRTGQMLQYAIEDLLHYDPAYAKYRLRLTVEEKLQPIGIEQDRRISRYNLIHIIKLALIRSDTGKREFKDTVKITTSYNIVQSDFASHMAERDARERAIQEAAEAIRMRLIGYFQTKGQRK